MRARFASLLAFLLVLQLQAQSWAETYRRHESPPASSDIVVNAGGRFDNLLGLKVGQSGVTFEVAGQGPGCTEKEHFHIERFGDDPVRLILIRDVPSAGTIPGTCRHNRVFRQRFFFSFGELELDLGDRIEIVNPIEVNNIPKPPVVNRQ